MYSLLEKVYDAQKCWKLHPEFNPEKFQNKEDKNTYATTIQDDLGSYFWDESKVVSTSIQGKNPSSFVSKNELVIDERNMNELFHIRVISKHTKN